MPYSGCKLWLIVTLVASLLLGCSGCGVVSASDERSAPVYRVRVVHTYPHDASAFTQGFEYHDGLVYEGTGLNGRSELRKEKLETGEVLQRTALSFEHFGEGITVLNGKVYELTWQSHIGFIYNQDDFRRLGTFAYPGEGWGVANDGHDLYLSDGSSEIRVLHPPDASEIRRIAVHDGTHAVERLNELEWVRGEIWANVWHDDRIARISPVDGAVKAWLDLTELVRQQNEAEPEAVLNGIAYDAAKDRVLVTGKLWPHVFEIEEAAH